VQVERVVLGHEEEVVVEDRDESVDRLEHADEDQHRSGEGDAADRPTGYGRLARRLVLAHGGAPFVCPRSTCGAVYLLRDRTSQTTAFSSAAHTTPRPTRKR